MIRFLILTAAVTISNPVLPGTAPSHTASSHTASSHTASSHTASSETAYEWTTDHVQVGVRWQPFGGRPGNNTYDARRPVIARDSSYVQFWVSWRAIEPTEDHRDYGRNPSPGLQAIEQAVDAAIAHGLKVEFVFFHAPSWATESGQPGGYKPKDGLFADYVRRIATHFKTRVDAYQLYHESNLRSMMDGATVDFLIEDILTAGARVVREVYEASPSRPVLVTTTGMSPCARCPTIDGLDGVGGAAIMQFYDRMIADDDLMKLVDGLNLNIADSGNGFGRIDSSVPSVWDQYSMLRGKLDAAGYTDKGILASESWVVWDDAANAHDVNGDGRKDERDAFEKTLTIFGQCLERGLNTINLPWADNSSGWAMGLTKRRDYNGRVALLHPDLVVAADDGGAAIVTAKLALHGDDETFTVHDGSGHLFSVVNYAVPSDPNHLHYSIWRWYAQLAAGADEAVRHAIAGQTGNDLVVSHSDDPDSDDLNTDGDNTDVGKREQYRMASWNHTRSQFLVLLYANARRPQGLTVSVPATVRRGRFAGEGFAEGDSLSATIETKTINPTTGRDENVSVRTAPAVVREGTITVSLPQTREFTTISIRRETVGDREEPRGD